jgi:hypothetical protein
VSKGEALQYLKLLNIDEKQAAKIYELAGGHKMYLKSIAEDIGMTTLEGMFAACSIETATFSPPL